MINGTVVYPDEIAGDKLYVYNLTAENYDEVPLDEIVPPGKGYWIATYLPGNIVATGVAMGSYTVPLDTGWNMVGSLSKPVAIADAIVVPDGAWCQIQHSDIIRQHEGMIALIPLTPGDGVWLNAREDCTFSLSI
ncbi:hypothetical protein [Methanogenium cariaci]|uniref:hypothetical protein n=1 Tax=Methanogenium cariaci TaxID=2197 RepID=UPI000784AD68|nr:hypothetical protein [Methanogenium cariaci]